MKSCIWFVMVLLVAVSCSKPPADQPEQKVSPVFEFPPVSSLGSADLESIRTAVGEKRIVMMGQAIRGSSELSRVSERLIRSLHEGSGFNLLLFEGSPFEFWIAQEEHLGSKASVESAGDFQRTALLAPWQTEEIRAVIDYALKTQAGAGSSDLYVSSYDVQIGQSRRFSQAKSVFEVLLALLQKRDRRISSMEQEAILSLEGLVSCQKKKFPDSDEQYAQAEQGINALYQVAARTARNSSGELHESMLTLLPKAASYTLEFCREVNENARNYTEVRDEWASKQFAGFVSALNQKVIVWAQSPHVRQSQQKDGRMSFGAYTRGAFPDETFAIQFTAGTGKAIAFTDDKGNPIAPAENTLSGLYKVSLERKLSSLSSMDFFAASQGLPAQFGNEETTRLELNGAMTIDPRKDFDGYYFVQTVTTPNLRR
jgi:erythromycin esterase-like protein